MSHLALKITDIVLEPVPRLHLDGEEMINVLEFVSGSELIVERSPHLLEVSKPVVRKRVNQLEVTPLRLEGNTWLMRKSLIARKHAQE